MPTLKMFICVQCIEMSMVKRNPKNTHKNAFFPNDLDGGGGSYRMKEYQRIKYQKFPMLVAN